MFSYVHVTGSTKAGVSRESLLDGEWNELRMFARARNVQTGS